MHYDLRYESRDRITTVSLPAQRTLASAEHAAQRLRSWAMIMDVPIAGAPVLVLEGSACARVHLPISGTFMPHPETGISRDELPATQVVIVPGVRFGELHDVEQELVSAFDAHGSAEYHTCNRDFYTGELRLPFRREPGVRPRFIETGAEGAAPVRELAGAVRAITVSSLPGAGGEAVAVALARKLAFRVVDEDLIVANAAESGTTPGELRATMTPRSFIQRVLDHMAQVSPMSEMPLAGVAGHGSPVASPQDCRRLLDREIVAAARSGDTVIAAPGAQFALADRPEVMRVLITASTGYRARRLVDAGANRASSAAAVTRADRDAASAYAEHYDVDWLDAAHYDLVLNIERFDLAAAADFIASLALQRMPHRAGGSRVPALPVAATQRAGQPGIALPAPAAW